MSKNSSGMKKNLTNYGDTGFSIFLRKAFIKGLGYSDDMLNKKIVGITNTFSDYNPCHGNVPDLVKSAKAGILANGAIPLEFPTITIHESFANPTSMYLRNLMSMDTEEMLRAQPMDACILIGGCDKTVPAQVMGGISADVPIIQLVTGPMLTGSFRGERVGACTDCRRFWASYRAEDLNDEDIEEVNNQLVPTVGTCGVMGTASTMAITTEALGLMVPNSACAPAVSADRKRIAEKTGEISVKIANENLKPSKFLNEKSFLNALIVLSAIGGSTNGVVHLTAMAGRLGVNVDLKEFDQLTQDLPMIVDLKPSGLGYMEDLYKAGGSIRIFYELKDFLHLDAKLINGKTLGDEIQKASKWNQDIITTKDNPVFIGGSIAVLNGSLAPGCAIIKQSAATQELLVHEGKAVVFENLEDLANRIDSDDLEVSKDDVLVLKSIGPKGGPGMPEAGLIPIPKKLARQGVKDMVRISDGRMSGTASGTIVLHVTPESYEKGPLAVVKNGDSIKLDVPNRKIDLLISEDELNNRISKISDNRIKRRGYNKLYMEEVTQANEGVDFKFLK
jgi:dihydroxy-acid dehydratase